MEDAPPLDNPDASPGAGEADDAIVEAEAPSGEPEQAGIAQPESEAAGVYPFVAADADTKMGDADDMEVEEELAKHRFSQRTAPI